MFRSWKQRVFSHRLLITVATPHSCYIFVCPLAIIDRQLSDDEYVWRYMLSIWVCDIIR